MEALIARYPKALEELFDVLKLKEHPRAAVRANVFDTERGWRLIVTRDLTPPMPETGERLEALHMSASVHHDSELYKRARAGMTPGDMMILAVQAWRAIAGGKLPAIPTLIGLTVNAGVPHYLVRVDGQPFPQAMLRELPYTIPDSV